MPAPFHMRIKDIFFYRDGRTVFAGPIDEGEKAIVIPGAGKIMVDGEQVATVQLEGEILPSRASPQKRLEVRAISTLDKTILTKEIIETKDCKLEGSMRYAGHRHLLGIDSPPREYIADDMTLGPRLPEGWDGDAWMSSHDQGYFLRAWNKKTACYAVAQADSYENARIKLLAEIARGGKKVEIRATEKESSSLS